MTERSQGTGDSAEVGKAGTYEPPRVEQVLTPAELEQEVRYAGDVTVDA